MTDWGHATVAEKAPAIDRRTPTSASRLSTRGIWGQAGGPPPAHRRSPAPSDRDSEMRLPCGLLGCSLLADNLGLGEKPCLPAINPGIKDEAHSEILRLRAPLRQTTEECDTVNNVWSAPELQVTGFPLQANNVCVNVQGLFAQYVTAERSCLRSQIRGPSPRRPTRSAAQLMMSLSTTAISSDRLMPRRAHSRRR